MSWENCSCGCGRLYFGVPGALHRSCTARLDEAAGRQMAAAVDDWRKARAELAKAVAK